MTLPRAESTQKLTRWQRIALRRLAKRAGKPGGEALSSEDWATYIEWGLTRHMRGWKRFLRSLPSSPRCGLCSAPFAGPGGKLLRPLGYRPSRKNPSLCATCVELAPPGGMTTDAGVLFADVRGFSELSERTDPRAVSDVLRRFYRLAEDALFPEAIIDKLIGDEVMALYLPAYGALEDPAQVMLAHARELLAGVGYGTPEGPFVELGVGLDYGEAFVGNIGRQSLQDFTAVGSVVNTAARLQAEARGGEIVASERLLAGSGSPPGEREELALKGISEAVPAYRIAVGTAWSVESVPARRVDPQEKSG